MDDFPRERPSGPHELVVLVSEDQPDDFLLGGAVAVLRVDPIEPPALVRA